MIVGGATSGEMAALFTLAYEGEKSGGHPGSDLLGRMVVVDLDNTTGRNVQEHVNGCERCQERIDAVMAFATLTIADRTVIAHDLGLSVPLTEAFRSLQRRYN